MPLPQELDDKIRLRFDEFIQEGNALGSAEVVEREDRYTTWSLRANTFLKWFFDHVPGSREDDLLSLFKRDQIYPVNAMSGLSSAMSALEWMQRLSPLVRRKVTVLKALRENYTNGDYEDLEERITSHVHTNLMEQAEALLGEGIERQYDHVPAAVLCGAVLEDALRRLCQRQKPPIDIVKSNGDKKTLEPLIQDLQRAKVFNKSVADQLRAWAKIRNYAAHGEFTEFTREQVDLMLPGVRQFLAVHQ